MKQIKTLEDFNEIRADLETFETCFKVSAQQTKIEILDYLKNAIALERTTKRDNPDAILKEFEKRTLDRTRRLFQEKTRTKQRANLLTEAIEKRTLDRTRRLFQEKTRTKKRANLLAEAIEEKRFAEAKTIRTYTESTGNEATEQVWINPNYKGEKTDE